jgi:hypothetical protein
MFCCSSIIFDSLQPPPLRGVGGPRGTAPLAESSITENKQQNRKQEEKRRKEKKRTAAEKKGG